MKQEFRLETKMQQRLLMTPMLQQALKILQLSTLELQQWVAKELQENPVLEEIEEDALPPQETAELPREPLDRLLEEKTSDLVDHLKAEDYTADAGRDFPIEEWMEQESSAPPVSPAEEATWTTEKQNFWESSWTRKPTLTEHLEEQLSTLDVQEPIQRAIRFLIGCLDEDGYLRENPEELAARQGFTGEEWRLGLKLLQSFDPPGVGARDLQECLLLQLQWRKGLLAEKAYLLVKEHFQDLAARRFANLEKAMNLSVEELKEILHLIASLEPKPGRAFGGEEPHVLKPDVVVEKVEGEYLVYAVEEDLPRLRVSPYYKKIWRESRKQKDDPTRRYLEEKIQSALWLIRGIEQRKRTLCRVTEAVFAVQRDFLEGGVAKLKPLTLKQVAEMIRMHESTVSRVTTRKYVQTPQGIYELKFFFTSGLETDSGFDVSSQSVKEWIREILAGESKTKPYSDQQIAKLLREKGVQVARRTVAKYREEMKIPPASSRRRLA